MSLYGVDISTYQSVGVQGKDFTIIRATYGTGYVDDKCDQHYQLAKQQNKLRGVYHYGYNRLNTAIDEANWFVDNIQGYIGDALLVLDNETTRSRVNGAIIHDATDVSWAKAWLDQVTARTGVRPLIYMNASTVSAADWSPVAADYALYCAGYPNVFNVSNPPTPADNGSDMPYDTGAFPFATIWQYSSSAGTLDRDIAYMTREAWNEFAAVEDTPIPSPADPVITIPVVTTPDPGTVIQPTTGSTTVINDPLPPVIIQNSPKPVIPLPTQVDKQVDDDLNAIEKFIEDLKTSKAGIKTSEFYTAVTANIAAFVEGVVKSPSMAVKVTALGVIGAITVVYIWSRTHVKKIDAKK